MHDNKIDLTNYTIDDLFRLPIGKLRDVAAFLGVDSQQLGQKATLLFCHIRQNVVWTQEICA